MTVVSLFRAFQFTGSDVGSKMLREMVWAAARLLQGDPAMLLAMSLFSLPIPPVDYSWPRYFDNLFNRYRAGHTRISAFRSRNDALAFADPWFSPAQVALNLGLPDPRLPDLDEFILMDPARQSEPAHSEQPFYNRDAVVAALYGSADNPRGDSLRGEAGPGDGEDL